MFPNSFARSDLLCRRRKQMPLYVSTYIYIYIYIYIYLSIYLSMFVYVTGW